MKQIVKVVKELVVGVMGAFVIVVGLVGIAWILGLLCYFLGLASDIVLQIEAGFLTLFFAFPLWLLGRAILKNIEE